MMIIIVSSEYIQVDFTYGLEYTSCKFYDSPNSNAITLLMIIRKCSNVFTNVLLNEMKNNKMEYLLNFLEFRFQLVLSISIDVNFK